MERFRVVAFETVFPIWDDQVRPRGGGVAFFPLESGDWPAVLDQIVRAHFHHHTVRGAEVGVSTLDATVLAGYCHQFGQVYWQGGDQQ
jgi:hypothetical protein